MKSNTPLTTLVILTFTSSILSSPIPIPHPQDSHTPPRFTLIPSVPSITEYLLKTASKSTTEGVKNAGSFLFGPIGKRVTNNLVDENPSNIASRQVVKRTPEPLPLPQSRTTLLPDLPGFADFLKAASKSTTETETNVGGFLFGTAGETAFDSLFSQGVAARTSTPVESSVDNQQDSITKRGSKISLLSRGSLPISLTSLSGIGGAGTTATSNLASFIFAIPAK